MSHVSTKIPTVNLHNGVTMPQFGLGVWQAKGDETETAVASALEQGYRLIDTAAAYGNETEVGDAIRADWRGGNHHLKANATDKRFGGAVGFYSLLFTRR